MMSFYQAKLYSLLNIISFNSSYPEYSTFELIVFIRSFVKVALVLSSKYVFITELFLNNSYDYSTFELIVFITSFAKIDIVLSNKKCIIHQRIIF